MITLDTALRRRTAVRAAGLGAGVLVLALLLSLSLAVGTRGIPLGSVWTALLNPGDGSRESIIVWQLRMPRTLLGIVVGAALAIAGVVMQAVSRNPLAEPGILGVNAGAALSVVLAISVLGVSDAGDYVWFALGGAVLATALVYGLGVRTAGPGDGAQSRVRLVLAGAALTACFGAVTGTVTMFDTNTFDSYRFWVVGSLANRDTAVLGHVLPFIVAGALVALALGPRLNALALGEDVGISLGVRPGRVRLGGLVAITLLGGAATAAAGPISFVGLLVPHALRLVLGHDVRWLLAYSVVAGPILVLAADIAGRVVARPGELEVGIVTAFAGAPVLLWLVTRRAGRSA
ncbi:FecCD family ABC transporter permease [Amycolatopsis sp. NBC_01480]|uniref:FecCD family ABC transporter permease n=1 Tax=Amycolatopsis sp. NBC_01480 TaxID=2903562 RepID=UPI002E2CB3E4|nr:iron chelate uptake ABC transporter family permease subunit [Amycolatopsis sp. NBC_01480]